MDTYREQLSGNIVKLIMMYTVNVGRLEKMTLKILSKKQREENLILSSTKNRTYVILLVTKNLRRLYLIEVCHKTKQDSLLIVPSTRYF